MALTIEDIKKVEKIKWFSVFFRTFAPDYGKKDCFTDDTGLADGGLRSTGEC